MASRCINTLNDLDKISNRIYHKHSKGRFRAGIEAKLKASREKAERSLREIDQGSLCSYKASSNPSNRSPASTSTATPSTRSFSKSASTTSRSVNLEWQKRAANEKTSKPSSTKSTVNGQRDQIQWRKTKSFPSCTLVNISNNNNKQSSDNVAIHIPRTASVFGKYNGEGSEYKRTAWFNLPIETSIGVVDNSACDEEREKPMCYSVNVKKGESVPKLLRHNLEVRVGQNGVVRTEKKREAVTSDVEDGEARQGKKRTAPLSWEEQLHWRNACIISSEPQRDGNSSNRDLCESHPVIFHEKKSQQAEKNPKWSEDKNHSNTYKLSLESRWVFADRRNVVSSGNKCITSVEIEDARSENEGVVLSDRKQGTDCANFSEKEPRRISNTEGKMPKKVSFEDEEAVKEKGVGLETEKELKKEEVTLVVPKIDDTDATVLANVREKIRPKTSCERSRTHDEEATKDVRKLQRPHTAPPAPPSSPRGLRGLSDSGLHNFFPIKIPTSQGEEESNNFLHVENENQKTIESSEATSPEEERQSDSEEEFSTFSVEISPGISPVSKDVIQDVGTPPKHVTFGGCKSAPVFRTTSRHEEVKTLRAKSSTAIHRSPYNPTPPIVVESKSSLELPKDLPPAQALAALRKKIRDDLAQQNHNLQLDIQRLYLKKHSDY